MVGNGIRRGAVRVGGAAAIALGAVPAAALSAGEPATADEAAPAPANPSAQIEAEIAAWVARDRAADPRATLAALLDLDTRSQATSGIAPRARGELAAMLASAHFAVQDVSAAIAALDRAAEAYAADDNAIDKQAEVYNNRAVLLRRQRRYSEGEAAAREAVRLRTGLYGQNHPDVASALGTLANLLYSQGRFDDAVLHARAAVASLEAAGGDNHLALVQRLDTLASILDDSGRSSEALRVAMRSENLAREQLGVSHNWYQYTVNTLGQIQLRLGLYDDALPNLRRVIQLREAQFGREHPFTQASVLVLATTLEETGQLEEATLLATSATGLLRDHTRLMDVATLAGFHGRMLRLLAATGDWTGYDREEPASVAIVDEVVPADNWARANFHVVRAQILDTRGRTAEALALAEQWVPVLVDRLPPESKERISGEILLIRLRQRINGNLPDALDQADPVIARLAGQFSALDLTESEVARIARASGRPLLTYLDMAVEAGDAERIILAAQLLNLSDLSLAQRQRTEIAPGAHAKPEALAHAAILDLARRIRGLDRQIAIADENGDDGGAEAIAASALELRSQLEAERQEAITAFRRQHPDYAARLRPTPASRAELAGWLAAGDLLALPVEGSTRGYSVLLSPDGAVAARPFRRDETAPRVAALRAALDSGGLAPFPVDAAAALRATLLPEELGTGGTIYVHGGTNLATIPWSLLLTQPHDGPLADAPWLVRRKAVQVLGNPALAAQHAATRPTRLTAHRQRSLRMTGIGGASAAEGVAGSLIPSQALFRSGAPDLDAITRLPPLAEAGAELAAIAAALPGRDDVLLVGPDALEERIKRADLQQADVIAFATHGLVAGEMASLWEPALLLGTADGSGEDGLLGASEIAQLRLDADWVILSACNTAAGESSGAPAYSGLATAFAQAGARGLMLSHWRVRDDAAARLTVETVRGSAEGLSRAEALRRAQLALMADRSVPDAAHPAIWAPFVIIEN